ncbi:GlmU family protein [Mangrovibacterium marinum]|uniref:UDP-N-acetylglucosamine diphosphorylase/glucosamine-1-phosphate N-acetyltransferase n=1 Tax=Mangrovibacterium marinum TaxID=1639118 RepID=A0A2T5C2E3_9BACT|nr:GlmU family protein [Mangrovibacterium marinum]PTN08837.1 UDP-N-acetylglucosamine diphosphorylase/glucosamine-1-phosphate N-acetyltransferase [Mangrovibacterium marinum]
MNIILFETDQRNCLLPLCYTRPVAELRTGILTIREKWTSRLSGNFSYATDLYLCEKFPLQLEADNILLSSHVCPTDQLARQVAELKLGEGIKWQGIAIAARLPELEAHAYPKQKTEIAWQNFDGELDYIRFPWDLNEVNARQIQLDFELLTKGRTSAALSATNQLLGREHIFVEEGACVEFAIINATTGPVYIGKNAEIMEGSLIRGPFAVGDHAVVNMGTKIYGPVTLGPHCKVGGELSHSILLGYSNKGHDGFLGHSVLGEWCNLGAGCNVSNLKNTYDKVKVWNYPDQKFIRTGLQFCGLIMGDHSKAGISTMFNTGTVVGVGCNIHGTGFPRQFVPSFSDGGAQGYKAHPLKSVFTTAAKAMARRSLELTDADQRILTKVFELSAAYRKY